MHSVNASSSSSTDTNVSTLVKRNQDCKAIDDSTGEPCGETDGLRILDEFRKLYENRIEKIDRESDGEFDRVSMKLQIMSDWIKDLGEQNTMLVNTVEDLEQAACSRVKLLEEKLKQSSQIVVDNLTRSNHSEEALNTLSNRVSQLQKDEEYLQQKIECLQSDIRGLLELIRRAYWQNTWSLEGITLFEIQPKDIPIPLDCICDQEQIETEQIKSLNLQVEQLQENEKKMIRSQLELKGKIEDLTTELLIKDETIKKYVSRLQCFYEKLKEYAKQTNQIIHPLEITSDQDYDITLTPDILESILIAKDTENKSLYRQLQDVDSKLMVYTYENNIDTNNLRMQLEEKCNKVQQLEEKIVCLEKEAAKTRDALTVITTLEEQNYHANIGNLLKDDLIKEMRKELKQVTLKDMSSQKICTDTSNFAEECSLAYVPHYSKKDELTSFLDSTKTHIQKECEILSDLKLELKKFLEKLNAKNNEANDCVISNNYIDEKKLYTSNMSDKLINCIEIITKMYSEREKEIKLFDGMIKKKENHCVYGDSKNIKSNINGTQQFKLMEEFRICTVEAQAATEDIREEMSTVISTFSSRHQNHEELNRMVINVQSYLIRTREGLIEAINRLELQEEERSRHSERIANSKFKLKDIKNQINHVQSELCRCINNMQGNIQEHGESGYMGVYNYNDLLTVVTEEVEQILINLQLFQTQGGCIISILKGLKSQLCAIDCSLKDLQKKTSEVLLNNEIANTTFCERECRLAKLEEEVDCAHTKMQDVLETFFSIKQEEQEQFLHSAFDNQEINDIIKSKEDLRKLKKEYDDLRFNMEQACQVKYDERLNKWKHRVTDLEDQIRVLQHEAKCKQETNSFLKNSIQSMEKELIAVRTKAENYKQCYSKDNIELKKKIIELENIIKVQKEVEDGLKKSLNSEIKVKKSVEMSNTFNMDHTEMTLLHCDYPSKHENIFHSFKTLQDAAQSAKMVVQDLESELKKLICEESSQLSVSARFVVILTEKLGKCKEGLDTCSHELSRLKNTMYSKEKLLENLEEAIRIQQDSLTRSQADVKDLYQKLQEKIDKQSFTIAQYEREKNELLKQNELQIQTIGHLQNAVVEAKRNLDQMGHKVMSDLCKKDEIIRQLAIYIDETQDQYNECFTETTNQDILLDLQRDAIESLHKRIRCLEYDKYLIATTLHTMYYAILNVIQEQIHNYVKDFRDLKWKMDSFIQEKNCSKYVDMKKMTAYTAQESKNNSCTECLESRNYNTRDMEHFLNSIYGTVYVQGYSDKEMKDEIGNIMQIQKLKAELQEIKDIECDLRCENQQLKIDLQHYISETENLKKRLERVEDKEIEYKKLILKLEDKEREIEMLNGQLTSKEEIINNKFLELEALKNELSAKNQQVEEDLSELNTSEHEILSIFCNRIHSLKSLLQEKSDYMVKLQADYELLKNENSILKNQKNFIENKTREDISELKEKLKEARLKLHHTENNYQQLMEDYNKVQKELLLITKREADSQESFMIMEKNYCSKIIDIETETVNLRDLVSKLKEELEEVKKKLASKNVEFSQMQDKCRTYNNQLNTVRQDFEKEKGKLKKIENENRDLIQQLQEYTDENYHLTQQKISLEENNSIHMNELRDMRKSLLELRKECHLKNQSLTYMLADLNKTATSKSELCKESQYIVSCIREYMEQQRKYNETLAKSLEDKQQCLMQLAFEKKALLVKIRKLKRINLLAQRLKKAHRQLTGRSLKKLLINDYISPLDIVKNAGINVISNLSYADLHKKRFTEPIRTGRRTLKCGDSWWFPKIEHLINAVRKNNQWWSQQNFNNETESDISLEESRDYGYQSSTSK